MSWLLGAGPRLRRKVTFRLPDRIDKIIKQKDSSQSSAQEEKENAFGKHIFYSQEQKTQESMQGTRFSNVRVTNRELLRVPLTEDLG